ncbi:hypothetical protein N8D55_11310 [Xanthomonas hortorum pv. pelargonii]|nr:hypothetical protein N8D55_11310 [Xanthomonas hortorum pv. pelargonii]
MVDLQRVAPHLLAVAIEHAGRQVQAGLLAERTQHLLRHLMAGILAFENQQRLGAVGKVP